MKGISKALDHLLRATGDPLRDLDAIGPDDPRFAYSEVIRAGIGVLAKCRKHSRRSPARRA